MSALPACRGRFAPSPTGPLHAGSLLAALGSWLVARQAGGQWLVRIEDIDPPRERPGAAADQLQTLARFGLLHDGTIEYQSRRDSLYQNALDRLLATGRAFTCHCSRSDLAAAGGIHRRCVARGERPDPAIRLRVPEHCEIAFDDAVCGPICQRVDVDVGDFVLRRADGLWAYQLAVVVDDAAQGITEVVRGADLLESTPRQVLLQQALCLPTPRYAHLPLLLDEKGRKLSKSSAALPVDAERPLETLALVWERLGQTPLPHAGSVGDFLRQALDRFRLDRVPASVQAPHAAAHNADSASHA